MNKITAQQQGGRVRAISSRKEALERYYSNPNFCLFCGEMILVKEGQIVGEMRKKKFCNRSHAATYNNSISPKRSKSPKYNKCINCDGKANSRSGLCLKCHHDSLNENAGKITKGDLFDKRSGYQSARSSIRRNANVSYSRSGKPYICAVCGYDTHVEICHLRSVSDHPDTATLSEINHPDNLIALCPNHHWEHDNLSSGNRI